MNSHCPTLFFLLKTPAEASLHILGSKGGPPVLHSPAYIIMQICGPLPLSDLQFFNHGEKEKG